MLNIRPPVFAGSFYNLDREMLKKQIEANFNHKLGPKTMKMQKVLAAIVPHAGYDFSGPVAAWVYSRLEKTNYVIIGPNHSGMGSGFALMKNGIWKTPLGEVVVDENFSQKLMDSCKILEYDVIAHEREHSIEVQLPFLQYRFGSDFKIVPICVMNDFADKTLLESCKLVGKTIGGMIKKQKERWTILASSDFSHYVPEEVAYNIDKNIIKAILKLKEDDFFDRINAKRASVCGFGPIATAIVAAKELRAKKGHLLKYMTSGETSGDTGSVVGYAGIIMS